MTIIMDIDRLLTYQHQDVKKITNLNYGITI